MTDAQQNENSEDTRYKPKPVPAWSYIGIRRRMRTMSGQLTMIGLSYAGAIVLAIAALFLKPILFEPSVRQRNPPVSDAFVARIQQVADGQLPPDILKDYTLEQVHSVYGMLIDGKVDDSKKIVTRKLAEYHSPGVAVRLKITAATGAVDQQIRALEFLTMMPDVDQADTICRYIREQAGRRKHNKLFRAADTTADKLNAMKGGS